MILVVDVGSHLVERVVLLVGNLHIGIRHSALSTRDVIAAREEGIAHHHSLQRMSFAETKGNWMLDLIR